MFVVLVRALAPYVAGYAAYQLTDWLFAELDHVHEHNHENAEAVENLRKRVAELEPKADVESEAKAVS